MAKYTILSNLSGKSYIQLGRGNRVYSCMKTPQAFFLLLTVNIHVSQLAQVARFPWAGNHPFRRHYRLK